MNSHFNPPHPFVNNRINPHKMKIKKILQCLKMLNPNRAFTSLVAVIVIAGVTLSIALTVSLSEVNQLRNQQSREAIYTLFGIADSCGDEAYQQLKSDEFYAGGTITHFTGGECNVVVAPVEGWPKTISIEANFQDYTQEFNATTNFISNSQGNAGTIDITAWQ